MPNVIHLIHAYIYSYIQIYLASYTHFELLGSIETELGTSTASYVDPKVDKTNRIYTLHTHGKIHRPMYKAS